MSLARPRGVEFLPGFVGMLWMFWGRWRMGTRSGIIAAAALALAGCTDPQKNYTPSMNVAEDAVRRALEAWKAGEPAGALPDTKPVIHVTDGGRKPGQKLESYAILGETSGTAGRTYAVTLHLSEPEVEVKTKYIVVGIDPLWVFRQEDYELLMHWDHHMPEKSVDQPPETAK